MRDEHDRAVGRAQLVDAARDEPQRVDVEAAVGLVEERQLRLEHRHLENLVALLLAAREADIDGALQKIVVDLQKLQLRAHGFEELAGVELTLAARAAARVHGGAQEIHVVHAGNLDRILERQEDAGARPLVGRERQQVAPLVEHAALGHLVAGLAGQDARERAFARAVRAHDRMHLAGRDGKVDALEDFAPLRQPRVQISDFQHHVVSQRCLRGSRPEASGLRPRTPSAALSELPCRSH